MLGLAKLSVGERIKKRLEALEQFRDVSIAGRPQLALSDAHLLQESSSSNPRRRTGRVVVSPSETVPSSCHSRCSQDQCVSTIHLTSTPPSEEDASREACNALPEESLRTLTPSLDGALSFEPCNDQSNNSIWQLSEVMDVRDDVSDTSNRLDTEINSLSDQPHDSFSEFMMPLGEGKVRAYQSPDNPNSSLVVILLRWKF